jgi:DNA-binding response OmpR family regulator
MFEFRQEEAKAKSRSVSKPVESRKGKTRSPTSKRKKPTVLVVDDERLIADTMTEILNRSGFQAFCAYDARTALGIATQTAVDYLITDVVIPVTNGIEHAISIRKVLPLIEILLLSGQAGITDMLERGRLEGYSFELLAKPIHPERLIERLKRSS